MLLRVRSLLSEHATYVRAKSAKLYAHAQHVIFRSAAPISKLKMDGFLDIFWSVCAAVGTLYILWVAIQLLSGLWGGIFAYILVPLGLGGGLVDLRVYGPWAAVTGASEGIGRRYALELARRGLNVVLMSRSREKLEKVAREIRETHGRDALIVPVDFTRGPAVYETLRETLHQLDIGLLVNNVGLSHKYAQYFLELDMQRARDIIELNCQAMVHMTHLLLPRMVDRGRGAIINISSYSSAHPQPLLGLYSSTKKLVNFFSEALSEEYSRRGILVQTVIPHFVSTEMTKIRRNIFVPTGADYSKSAVGTIGIQGTTYGCLPHAIVCSLTNLTPKFIITRLAFAVLSYARSRYLRLASKK